MTRSNLAALSGVALAVVAVSALVSSTRAQDMKTTVNGPQPRPAPTPMVGQMPTPMPGMPGPAAMVSDGSHLFILQGNRLLKVKKSDLSIEAEKPLRPRVTRFGSQVLPDGPVPPRPDAVSTGTTRQ